MYRDSILGTLMIVVIPVVFIYGFYVQWHGDYSPGGGFQAGVIVASAFMMYALVNKSTAMKKFLSLNRLRILSALGVMLYFGVGIACMFHGGKFLEYSSLIDAPSAHHLGILLVELGVGITVCSSMLSIFFAFTALKENLERN